MMAKTMSGWALLPRSNAGPGVPIAAQAETMQHHRYVQMSVNPPSISVASLPVSCLKRSIAPIVCLQGYALPLIVISTFAMIVGINCLTVLPFRGTA